MTRRPLGPSVDAIAIFMHARIKSPLPSPQTRAAPSLIIRPLIFQRFFDGRNRIGSDRRPIDVRSIADIKGNINGTCAFQDN